MTKTVGLVGVGAFGALAAKHLAPHFDLVLCDANSEVAARVAKAVQARTGSFAEAVACDCVIFAVPVQKLRAVLAAAAPLMREGALALDVCSVKIGPLAAMMEILPPGVSVVGTHPLFGPQSGKNGIAGLNMAVVEGRGGRGNEVAAFCAEKLKLAVKQVTAEEHDREAAYVQGLTHMLAKIVVALDLPDMKFPTRTYELMQQMVEMVRYDSEDLFRAIESENPFSPEAKKRFFAAARQLEEKLIDNN